MKISIIHGPNLNMLGVREPKIYGKDTLQDINNSIEEFNKKYSLDFKLDFFQSNIEGELVTYLQNCHKNCDGVIINPAAYSHTSIALRDAISLLDIPVIEVHISQVYKREKIRQTMMTAPSAYGVLSGFGKYSYHSALMALSLTLKDK